MAALQGEPEVMRSHTVLQLLAAVAALGAAVAGWTARRLAAWPTTPIPRAAADLAVPVACGLGVPR